MNDYEKRDSLARLWPLIKEEPALFADKFLLRNEKGQPWKLSRYQRRVIAAMFRRPFPIRIDAGTEEERENLLAAVLVLWWAIVTPSTEIIVAANDLDQSVGRVFATMVALIKKNPGLLSICTILAERILFKNGTIVSAIASEYKGVAGSRHSLVVYDELWGYSSEKCPTLVGRASSRPRSRMPGS